MVKKQLTQKEQDLKYIQRRINYIEKMGVDTSHLPKLTKRHSQAKITDLRLHLEKNTKYRFTKLKTSTGEVIGQISKAEQFSLQQEAKRFLKAGGFVRKGATYEGGKRVALYQYNKAQITVNQLATYMHAIGKAQEKVNKASEKIDVTKQLYQIFAEEMGMKDPIKSKDGDQAKPTLTNIKTLEGQKGREIIDYETKKAMEFDLDVQRREIYGDVLQDIVGIWGEKSTIIQTLKTLDYTDLEILRSMFNNDNEFYATMYGSDGQGDRSEDVKRERGNRLKEKLNELLELKKAKDEALVGKQDMTLGGRN